MTKKVRPGDRIAQLLLGGDPVPVSVIHTMFQNDPKLAKTDYKISGYIGDIRKYHQGVVAVVKNGREVLSYQLMNAWAFDANGHSLRGDALVAALAARDPTQPVPVTANTYTSIAVTHSADGVDVNGEDVMLTPDDQGEVTYFTGDEVSVDVPEVAVTAMATPARGPGGKFTKKAA